MYCVENVFNPTCEVQNIENGVYQNAPFTNGRFPNVDYSCLWARLVLIVPSRYNMHSFNRKLQHIFIISSSLSSSHDIPALAADLPIY